MLALDDRELSPRPGSSGAAEMEEWVREQQEYGEAAKCWKILGFPYELAMIEYELAVVNHNMGKIDAANERFENAREIFEKLGARLGIEKAMAAKKANEDLGIFSITRLRGSLKESSRLVFD